MAMLLHRLVVPHPNTSIASEAVLHKCPKNFEIELWPFVFTQSHAIHWFPIWNSPDLWPYNLDLDTRQAPDHDANLQTLRPYPYPNPHLKPVFRP